MYPPFNKLSDFKYSNNCNSCGGSWFSETINYQCPLCKDHNLEYTRLSNSETQINKQELKDTLKDMFKSGEIKVNFSFEDLWDEAHLSIDIDDEEVYHGSIHINIIKEIY